MKDVSMELYQMIILKILVVFGFFRRWKKTLYLTDDTVSPNRWVCEFVSEMITNPQNKETKTHYFEMTQTVFKEVKYW